MSLIERVQKFDCATPGLSEKAVHFHDAGAVVGGRCPVPLASEHLFQDNDEVALQQLPRNFAINFEARMA